MLCGIILQSRYRGNVHAVYTYNGDVAINGLQEPHQVRNATVVNVDDGSGTPCMSSATPYYPEGKTSATIEVALYSNFVSE